MTDFMFVPIVLFLIFVAPLWLILHYRDKRRRHRDVSRHSDADSISLQQYAEKLEQRVEALETILDSEVPGWRQAQ